MEAEEYEEFLTSTARLITRRLPDGTVAWQEDKEVIRAHFTRRRELGLKIADDESMPVCLSRWHPVFKKEQEANL